MNSRKDEELVTILASNNNAIISVAASLLDEAKIKYSIKPDGHKRKSGLQNPPLEIQVSRSEQFEAKKLLADLEEINFEE